MEDCLSKVTYRSTLERPSELKTLARDEERVRLRKIVTDVTPNKEYCRSDPPQCLPRNWRPTSLWPRQANITPFRQRLHRNLLNS